MKPPLLFRQSKIEDVEAIGFRVPLGFAIANCP